jgi:hypothetical protein
MNTHSPCRDGRFGVEGLETREVMAGNVTAAVNNGVLNIVGDNQSNGVLIQQIGDKQFKITGQNQNASTTINGQAYVTVSNVSKDIVVNLNGGDDFVIVEGLAGYQLAGSLKVNAGDGYDSVSVNKLTVQKDLVVQMGAGDDSASVRSTRVGQDVKFDGSTGDDSFSTNDSIVGRDASVSLGAGSDSASFYQSSIRRDVKVVGEAGDDSASVSKSEVYRDASLSLGADYGNFNVYDSTIRRDLKITNDGAANVNLALSKVGRDVSMKSKGYADNINVYATAIQGNLKMNTDAGADNVNVLKVTLKGDLAVDSGSGADDVSIYESQADEIFTDLGNDLDYLYVGKVKARGGSFKGGSGADRLSLGAGNVFTKSPKFDSFVA